MKKYFGVLLLLYLILSTVFSIAQTGSWTVIKTTNNIPARSECSLATVGDKIYLIGGDGPAENVEAFDPLMLKWTEKAMTPVPFHHFQAVALGNKIYVLDAFVQGQFPDQLPAENTYSYDTENNTWHKLAGLPADRRRAGAGAAERNGKLYLVCGIKHGHSSGTNNLFDEYDPATDKWTALPDAPHIRDHSSAVVIGDKLYAVGGRNTSYHEPGNFMSFFSKTVLDVDCYDFKTGKWSTLDARLPLGTGGGTAVNLDGKLFYIGGERATDTKPNGPQKDVFYLDTNNPTGWHKAADLNQARNGVGSTVFNHKIYIAGGLGGGPGGPQPVNRPGEPQVDGIPGDPPQNRMAATGQQPPPPPGGHPGGPGGNIVIELFSFNN